MQTTFQVFAEYTSAISGAKVRFQLVQIFGGFAFKNLDTGNVEIGTFIDAEDKFACLTKFADIFKEMQPAFHLA